MAMGLFFTLIFCLFSSSLTNSQTTSPSSTPYSSLSNSSYVDIYNSMLLAPASNALPSLEGVSIACFIHPRAPTPRQFHEVTTSSCNAAVADILMEPDAMTILAWTRNAVPQKWVASGCSVTINTQDAAAHDTFQIALVARVAALITRECVTNIVGPKLGGKVVIGPKHYFNVTVIGQRISNGLGGVATS